MLHLVKLKSRLLTASYPLPDTSGPPVKVTPIAAIKDGSWLEAGFPLVPSNLPVVARAAQRRFAWPTGQLRRHAIPLARERSIFVRVQSRQQ